MMKQCKSVIYQSTILINFFFFLRTIALKCFVCIVLAHLLMLFFQYRTSVESMQLPTYTTLKNFQQLNQCTMAKIWPNIPTNPPPMVLLNSSPSDPLSTTYLSSYNETKPMTNLDCSPRQDKKMVKNSNGRIFPDIVNELTQPSSCELPVINQPPLANQPTTTPSLMPQQKMIKTTTTTTKINQNQIQQQKQKEIIDRHPCL